MDAITKDLQKPAPWTLLYADDVMLASEDKIELESQVQTWSDRLAMFGLRLNVKKAEYLTTDSSELGSIKINGTELTQTTTFKYLGSAIASDGSLGFETKSRVNAAWLKWRSMTGVLCDKNIPEQLKSKIYRTVIRPVTIYGAECWPATKEVEARLSVMETKMLRWTAGVTRLDRISNAAIRERFGVAPIVEKMPEARLLWYGHTLRAKSDTVRKIGLNLDVSGKRPRGRPKQRWLDTLHEDLKAVNIHPDQAFNREKWHNISEKRTPPTSGTNAKE
nr:endonuclease-reverse transcriptase HmRTE-e01 [Haemonchus contortus]